LLSPKLGLLSEDRINVQGMRYGFIMPGGDARRAAELAALAEQHGWDGFFVWEGIWAVDAWVALTAAAMRTERIQLGTMLTPLPRRRPWELASQTATLDNLSGGRVILSVGLGVSGDEPRFWIFEDDPGRRVRAELLDEGLDMVQHLWRGQPFSYQGKHYRARRSDQMLPPPTAQQPRIPIWVVGAWPRVRSMRRVARFDGWLPNYLPPQAESGETLQRQAEFTPEIAAEALDWLHEERADLRLDSQTFDAITEGTTPHDDPEAAAAKVQPWADVGFTWWLEANWQVSASKIDSYARERLAAGPPRIEEMTDSR
jgi:alkanesulfonate monooxygenase SsuD/methylene tetrahydromethanopterin reductase-like flavin-dependent oxidoreductase (luciferase family)